MSRRQARLNAKRGIPFMLLPEYHGFWLVLSGKTDSLRSRIDYLVCVSKFWPFA